MQRALTTGQSRQGFLRGHRMLPSYGCLFMPCERRSFSGRGVVVINSSTGLYADPAFNSVSVFALHRRLRRAVCCSFGLGALRQSCFSCSLCAASSVSPCAVALAVGADLLWALLAVRMPLTVWAALRSGWRCLYSAASSGPYPCRLHAPAGSR